jgi:hypothetical protein
MTGPHSATGRERTALGLAAAIREKRGRSTGRWPRAVIPGRSPVFHTR